MQADYFNTNNDTSIFADTQAEYLPAGLAHTVNTTKKGLAFNAKKVAGHMLGTVTLAVALLAQSSTMAMMTAVQAGTGTPASHNSLVTSALPSTGAPSNSQYFASTGKTVNGDFLNVYNKYGLSRIGYPVSEETSENGTKVQYFERVRMEFHPEVAKSGY